MRMTFADDKAKFFKEGLGIEEIAVDEEAICSISKPKQRHSALQTVTAYLTELL